MLLAKYEVMAIDNYYRRIIADKTDSGPLENNPLLPERCEIFKECSGGVIRAKIGDLCSYEFMSQILVDFRPDTIIHYAEQPSAPYSMMGQTEARETFNNNLTVTQIALWQCLSIVRSSPRKTWDNGEYGTPNIDIEEGWIDITHNGRSDTFLFPRAASSLYHTTKVLDTDLLWFYVRSKGLRVTDLMQGPVYGVETEQTLLDPELRPNFHYDDLFGTVVNRFIVQAVTDVPLTVYGRGGQTRGYLNLKDTLKCVELACENPAASGELRIFNQITETFSVNDLAAKVAEAGATIGLKVKVQTINNPRKERRTLLQSTIYRLERSWLNSNTNDDRSAKGYVRFCYWSTKSGEGAKDTPSCVLELILCGMSKEKSCYNRCDRYCRSGHNQGAHDCGGSAESSRWNR